MIQNLVPQTVRNTAYLRVFGLFRIPLLFFISPSVVELDDRVCVIRVPLNRRTRNHLHSMYFGVLCAGADCAGGLIAMRQIQELAKRTGSRISLVFKDFKAEFLKRAEGDVHFTCSQGDEIQKLVRKADLSGEREELAVHVEASVPSVSAEPVAKFVLTLSLKRKSAQSS